MDLPLNHLGKGWTKRQNMAQQGGSREWLFGGAVFLGTAYQCFPKKQRKR